MEWGHVDGRLVEDAGEGRATETAAALTATFHIEKRYSGTYRLIVTAPNGDCVEFQPRGERAQRVLREAAQALELQIR